MKYYPGQFYPSSWVEVALWCNWMPPEYLRKRNERTTDF